jgi:hypothetical protein
LGLACQIRAGRTSQGQLVKVTGLGGRKLFQERPCFLVGLSRLGWLAQLPLYGPLFAELLAEDTEVRLGVRHRLHQPTLALDGLPKQGQRRGRLVGEDASQRDLEVVLGQVILIIGDGGVVAGQPLGTAVSDTPAQVRVRV